MGPMDSGTRATGQAACRASAVLTGPGGLRPKMPNLGAPRTNSRAVAERSRSTGIGGAFTSSALMSSPVSGADSATAAVRAISSASSPLCRQSSTSHCRGSMPGPESPSAPIAQTRRSGARWRTASAAAQRKAASVRGEPSIPARIGGWPVAHICFASFRFPRDPMPDRSVVRHGTARPYVPRTSPYFVRTAGSFSGRDEVCRRVERQAGAKRPAETHGGRAGGLPSASTTGGLRRTRTVDPPHRIGIGRTNGSLLGDDRTCRRSASKATLGSRGGPRCSSTIVVTPAVVWRSERPPGR